MTSSESVSGRDDWYKFSCSVDYDARPAVKTEIELMERPDQRPA